MTVSPRRRDKVLATIFVLLVALTLFSGRDGGFLNSELDQNNMNKFTEIAGIMVPKDVNANNHLYPYLASVFTCGCILLILMTIILFGGDLGSSTDDDGGDDGDGD